MKYQRDIKKTLLIYRVTLALLLASSLTIIIFKAYDYLLLIAVAYFIREFIFPIYFVFITEEALTVERIFLGGLARRKFTLDRNKIIELTNIDAGVTIAFGHDPEYGLFSEGDDTIEKKLERYRIKWLSEFDAEKTIKVPLVAVEANILSQRLQPATTVL